MPWPGSCRSSEARRAADRGQRRGCLRVRCSAWRGWRVAWSTSHASRRSVGGRRNYPRVVSPEQPPTHLTVAGLFAGVGGLEVGLGKSGLHAVTLVESWEPARQVLRTHFPDADLL